MTDEILPDVKLRFADIGEALRRGRRLQQALPRVSTAYAAVFVVLGVMLLTAIGVLGVSPLVLPFAGGFMLIGPILLTGFFEFARLHAQGIEPTLADALRAFGRASAGLWALALLCAFLFLIWITDAGVLYSFTIGGAHFGYDFHWLAERGGDVLRFELLGSLMGSALAYMIFTISAFSVPLVCEKRTGVVRGVTASARAVLRNFPVTLTWGLLLSVMTFASILLLPALLLTLPLMSFASYHLYKIAFPLPSGRASVNGSVQVASK